MRFYAHLSATLVLLGSIVGGICSANAETVLYRAINWDSLMGNKVTLKGFFGPGGMYDPYTFNAVTVHARKASYVHLQLSGQLAFPNLCVGEHVWRLDGGEDQRLELSTKALPNGSWLAVEGQYVSSAAGMPVIQPNMIRVLPRAATLAQAELVGVLGVAADGSISLRVGATWHKLDFSALDREAGGKLLPAIVKMAGKRALVQGPFTHTAPLEVTSFSRFPADYTCRAVGKLQKVTSDARFLEYWLNTGGQNPFEIKWRGADLRAMLGHDGHAVQIFSRLAAFEDYHYRKFPPLHIESVGPSQPILVSRCSSAPYVYLTGTIVQGIESVLLKVEGNNSAMYYPLGTAH